MPAPVYRTSLPPLPDTSKAVHIFPVGKADNLPSLRKPDLIRLVRNLQEKNEVLESEVLWLKTKIRTSTGEGAELYILEQLNAIRSKKNDAHDMSVRGGEIRLEVKASRRNKFKVGNGVYRRWTWHNLLGVGKKKVYHRLILVGEADSKYIKTYKDKNAPYVIFDVPYKWAKAFANEKKRAQFCFHLQTKKSGAKGIHPREMWQFEVTLEELISKYKVK